jgi:hypothetical protein
MKKVGVFNIETSFLITGRGIVAVGTINEGRISVGTSTTVEIDGKKAAVKIIGTETRNPNADEKLPFGILLSFADQSLEKTAATMKLKTQTIEIFEE